MPKDATTLHTVLTYSHASPQFNYFTPSVHSTDFLHTAWTQSKTAKLANSCEIKYPSTKIYERIFRDAKMHIHTHIHTDLHVTVQHGSQTVQFTITSKTLSTVAISICCHRKSSTSFVDINVWRRYIQRTTCSWLSHRFLFMAAHEAKVKWNYAH